MLFAGARVTAFAFVFLLVAATVPAQAQSTPLPGLGMDQGSVAALQQAGAPPAYGSYWVGAWMAVHGWAGLDNALKSAKATGVTPVVYWYYWGDSITPSCVESGCDGKTKPQWESMTQTLADKIRLHMGGAPVIIVLENEFNKGGITDTWYAPTFDGYLEARTATLKQVPGVHVSIGFGSWGEDAWKRFPKAIAAADSIGFQLMRASTRDTEAQYRGSGDKIASVLTHIKGISGKSAFLYDVALSSYPDSTYRAIQAETLAEIMDRRAEYAANGLVGLVYRELRDNPSMGTHNYFGIAEQYWGFRDIHGNAKPAWEIWRAASNAQPGPVAPPSPNVPGAFEGEAMTASTGGRNAESAASGGATWNLWTNGDLRKELHAEQAGTYRVTVVARGAPAGGVDARMEIRLDDATLAAYDVPAGLRAYAVDAKLPAGRSVLSVRFTNDVLTATEDRNLYVDVVRVAAPPANQAPVARFTTSAADLTVAVDASGSSDADGDALAYQWSFGDGTTATGVTASRAYAQGGTYTVTLTVSDGQASATSSATVAPKAANRAPAAVFDALGGELEWLFDATGTTDADGDGLTFTWDFGDGGQAQGVKASRRYASAGTYAVTLTVSDGQAASTATRTVTATQPNRAPAAAFTVAGADLAWSFDASGSSDADGDALSYQWSFGDGTTATGAKVSRTYAQAGAYTVTLTVSDGQLSSGATRAVQATQPNRAPTASFRASGADMTWTLDASASGDADGDALTYQWTFADGTTLQGVRVTRTFAAPGDQAVRLLVGDARGLGDEETTTVAAREPATSARLVQAEAFSGKDNGAAFTDAAASDGKAWLLWSNGAMRQAFAPGAGTHRVEVVAKGDYAGGWPIMELRADGVVVGRWSVSTSTWSAYGADVAFQAGQARTLSVHFTNDAYGQAGDRNLRVDLVRVTPPPVLVEGEAFAAKDNGMAFKDAAASGGGAWLLWSNGAMTHKVAPGEGTWAVEVVAKGDQAAGAPIMELRADGALVARWTVSATSWQPYKADVTMGAMGKTLSVHFVNDYRGAEGDRNVRIDAVRLSAK